MDEETSNIDGDLTIFAEPGDTDLSCDIKDIVVQSVLSINDDELMLVLSGGSGMITSDGYPQHFISFEEIQLVGGFHDNPNNGAVTSLIVDVLEQWRAAGTKLRVLGAPGKITTLIESRDHWVPFPAFLGT